MPKRVIVYSCVPQKSIILSLDSLPYLRYSSSESFLIYETINFDNPTFLLNESSIILTLFKKLLIYCSWEYCISSPFKLMGSYDYLPQCYTTITWRSLSRENNINVILLCSISNTSNYMCIYSSTTTNNDTLFCISQAF